MPEKKNKTELSREHPKEGERVRSSIQDASWEKVLQRALSWRKALRFLEWAEFRKFLVKVRISFKGKKEALNVGPGLPFVIQKGFL